MCSIPKEDENTDLSDTQKNITAWSADPNNPRNRTKHRKWAATLTACYMSSLVSMAASAYSQAVNQMVTDLRAPYLLVVSGISFSLLLLLSSL